ncbi:putative bifunctional diguanylate cyclase/phosphodiesterase [Cellulomonas edaphi]|uniref:EAL domain-containing protein n=1 Tax=Cellulomonas edaphi TaxID=3053468 RepID=A0ABT7SBC0_9CELL|nr:EAL domain-containing protein [Cellulomons edaphi]MDM7832312.1 EAL domain-containing protein [Cellulomons edaphi]
MRSSRSRRRWSLTRYFAFVSILAMAILGFALVWVTSTVMRQQSVNDGVATAESVVAYAAAPLSVETFSGSQLTPEQTAAVKRATSGFGERLVDLRLWSTVGVLMYSQADAETGFPDPSRNGRVLADGEPDAAVIVDVRSGSTPDAPSEQRQVLDVYVPVFPADARAEPSDADSGVDAQTVIGTAEVMLDHAPASAALRSAVGTVTLVVTGGLVALWLLLFRTVFTTSKRLQTTALENARLALLDSLTGLPNRRLLTERMTKTVAEAQRDGARLGMVLLDIDRFKDINDSLGHDHGDELLEQVADRLRKALRDEDVVARLGGDEFAILLTDVRSVEDAERLARRVRGLFTPPFQLGEMSLHVETSVGVSCLPDHADDASSLMRTADVAMYSAKHRRTGVATYSPDEDHSSPARLVLLGDLHRALDPEPGAPRELELHYQPKVDLDTGRILGLEALMRWQHPTRGMLLPSVFIPLAEQSGIIHRLTRYALTAAVEQLADWLDEGRSTPVAVNLSAHDVTSGLVVDVIEELLSDLDVPADLLDVEITETALVADPSRVTPVLERLAAVGVRVAIDDFGIGNTSIAQLRDLPVHELKIDRLFVTDLDDGGRESAHVVVQAMVDLAHSFGLRVVAEGVEDEITAATLRRLGVDQAQGYLYSRAVPAADVVALAMLPDPDRSSTRAPRRGTRGEVDGTSVTSLKMRATLPMHEGGADRPHTDRRSDRS